MAPESEPGPGRRLQGAGVLVTRPAHQQQACLRHIRAEGGEPWSLPLIEIEFLNPAPQHISGWDALSDNDWLVAVSPNAVTALQRWVADRRLRLPALRFAAVGEGSARALEAAGWPVSARPRRGDGAQALLDSPGFQPLPGRPVVLARGEGGRRVLDEGLTQAGATLVDLRLYRRRRPALGLSALRQALAQAQCQLLFLTSGTALQHLMDASDSALREQLQSLAVVAPSERVLKQAQTMGFHGPLLAASDASDQAMVERAAQWWRTQEQAMGSGVDRTTGPEHD
ncbi:uroporphyrinogen-III synthase [Natronospira proteinivora]|uniref:Uroporphyrinogen-III synthase n=1 Tax=Natronospira proteinivora TaxID=1807133 RepID=A0ABT1G9Y1_9GAMM|nr:uroporphyrinogen-III synthase [Natronospira proteinivora]MCP1728128.1 uroporphyrinogen-III synthase [Natronospira proteinivora]